MTRRSLIVGCCAAGALVAAAATPALAQEAAQARGLVAACFTCHGTDGHSVGGIPASLAGQSRDDLLQAMKEFRDGKRPATIMHQQAKGYTDRELEAIAAYFANVKPRPAAKTGSAIPAGASY
ncbi:MAG: twin-arginine translocation signal domain-containing protein [Betaproteobacteria bacterium]|nr:twin-arginine translocation signal domain-containing protein [Betaproteobacteria bacterium]